MKTSKLSLEVALKEIDFLIERIFPVSETIFENELDSRSFTERGITEFQGVYHRVS